MFKPENTVKTEEQITTPILAENVDTDSYPSILSSGLTSIDDTMIAEMLLDRFQTELDSLKNEIAIFKSRHLVDGDYNTHQYLEKKTLICDYINCDTMHEKEGLKQKIVSFVVTPKNIKLYYFRTSNIISLD